MENDMKIGLSLGGAGEAVQTAQLAERLGFDYVASGEHLFFHGPTPNAFVHLAAAAGATSHIRLLSSITLLPLYPAALAAKLAAALDVVSGGRFEFGVGAGGEYPPEFQAVGVDPAERFRRLDEGLTVVRQLFSGESVSFDGEFTTLEEVTLDPAPLQQNGPPIWLGGRKRGAIRRAARHADVWLPYMVDPQRFEDSTNQVRSLAQEFGRGDDAVSGALFIWTCVDEDRDWARETGIRAVSTTYSQDFTKLADRYLLLGTPDDVLNRLREFADAGAEYVVVQVAAPPSDRRRVIDTLAREVIPGLRGSRPS